MKITVTTTSQTLQQLLSAGDYGILRWYYTTLWGGIFHNVGNNTIYIETGKTATSSDSYRMLPDEKIGVGFVRDALETQFVTSAGTSDLLIIF